MRIATWNVNSLKVRLPRVEEWLTEVEPDVLCMQETKLADTAFPAMSFQSLGYESVHVGEGRWNGVAILSHVGISDVHAGFADGGDPDSEARLVWATCDGVRIASIYVPNGRDLAHDHYRYKLDWLARLRADLAANCKPSDEVIVCGDFNVAPTDDDVWDIASFDGSTHVSPPDREAVESLEQWGLHDLFRAKHPDPGLFSYWDYRAGMFHKKQGMRIDLVLGTAPLAERLQWSLIDRNARKGKLPSDHAPVVVEVAR